MIQGKKQRRFAAIKQMSNVLEYPLSNIAGNWTNVFNSNYPIQLELACGKGEYTIELARRNPTKNFIGIDIKGNRLWTGATKALEQDLHNVRFLRMHIQNIHQYFGKNEVKDIWIVYPDPFIRLSKQKNRLTHPNFLRLYQAICKPTSHIYLKTDSPLLYYFTLDVIEAYQLPLHNHSTHIYKDIQDFTHPIHIRTYYESLDIANSNQIYHVDFSLGKNVIDNKHLQLLKDKESSRKNA